PPALPPRPPPPPPPLTPHRRRRRAETRAREGRGRTARRPAPHDRPPFSRSPRNAMKYEDPDHRMLYEELTSSELRTVGCYLLGDTIGQDARAAGRARSGHAPPPAAPAHRPAARSRGHRDQDLHRHRAREGWGGVRPPDAQRQAGRAAGPPLVCAARQRRRVLPQQDVPSPVRKHRKKKKKKKKKKTLRRRAATPPKHTGGFLKAARDSANPLRRDLKLENMMLDSEDTGNIKLIDFGFSAMMPSPTGLDSGPQLGELPVL
ncbi:MAG: hypothetical protein BJ554DRAFT_1031, partial [Olpidium bornovanus]